MQTLMSKAVLVPCTACCPCDIHVAYSSQHSVTLEKLCVYMIPLLQCLSTNTTGLDSMQSSHPLMVTAHVCIACVCILVLTSGLCIPMSLNVQVVQLHMYSGIGRSCNMLSWLS